ncbi:MAG: hypothetical protein ACM3NN_10955 [Nitrospirota bacterium]
MQQLAKLIESRMRGQWKHAAVHESDLQCIWPLNDQDRERKIAEFATHYGFRLRFYIKGMCAIFDKWPPDDRPESQPWMAMSRPASH